MICYGRMSCVVGTIETLFQPVFIAPIKKNKILFFFFFFFFFFFLVPTVFLFLVSLSFFLSHPSFSAFTARPIRRGRKFSGEKRDSVKMKEVGMYFSFVIFIVFFHTMFIRYTGHIQHGDRALER